LLQGISLEATKKFFRASLIGVGAMGVAMVSMGLAVVMTGVMAYWTARRFAAVWQPYKYAHNSYPPFVRWSILPAGHWGPQEYSAKYGALFSSLRESRQWFCTVTVVKTIALGVVAGAEMSSCSMQFSVIAAVAAVYALLTMLFMPSRSLLTTVLGVLSNVMVALVAMGAATVSLQKYLGGLYFAATALSIVSSVWQLSVSMFLEKRWKKAELRERKLHNDTPCVEAASATALVDAPLGVPLLAPPIATVNPLDEARL